MTPEKQFENRIKNYLKSKGIYHFKYFGNVYSQAGVLDLTACVNGHFVSIEVKAENGRVSKLQQYNIEKIHESGGTAIVLKPSGFNNFKQMIEELLND